MARSLSIAGSVRTAEYLTRILSLGNIQGLASRSKASRRSLRHDLGMRDTLVFSQCRNLNHIPGFCSGMIHLLV